jgi:arsenate reductase
MKKSVIVLCMGNACRSQMAEGYLHYYTQGRVSIHSAGIRADGLHPMAVEVMKEDGIDISQQYSKKLDTLADQVFDFTITVCDEAANLLPPFPASTQVLHIHFQDPSQVRGTQAEIRNAFLQVREQVKKFILKFVGRELMEDVQTAA